MPLPSVILDWMSISFPMVSCLNCALGLRSVFACNVESTAALSNLSPRCFARMNFVLPEGKEPRIVKAASIIVAQGKSILDINDIYDPGALEVTLGSLAKQLQAD